MSHSALPALMLLLPLLLQVFWSSCFLQLLLVLPQFPTFIKTSFDDSPFP